MGSVQACTTMCGSRARAAARSGELALQIPQELGVKAMAGKKRIDVSVTMPGFMSTQWSAVARDTASGTQVAYAYGGSRQEVVAKVVQRVRQLYGSDAEILY